MMISIYSIRNLTVCVLQGIDRVALQPLLTSLLRLDLQHYSLYYLAARRLFRLLNPLLNLHP